MKCTRTTMYCVLWAIKPNFSRHHFDFLTESARKKGIRWTKRMNSYGVAQSVAHCAHSAVRFYGLVGTINSELFFGRFELWKKDPSIRFHFSTMCEFFTCLPDGLWSRIYKYFLPLSLLYKQTHSPHMTEGVPLHQSMECIIFASSYSLNNPHSTPYAQKSINSLSRSYFTQWDIRRLFAYYSYLCFFYTMAFA